MGTPVPPIVPVVEGEPCTICWGAGKTFGDGPTPISIEVYVTGIQHGPNWVPADGEAPEGFFTVPQIVLQPCVYLSLNSLAIIWFNNIIGSQLVLQPVPTPFNYFFGELLGVCQRSFVNLENDHFTGGTGEVILPPVL